MKEHKILEDNIDRYDGLCVIISCHGIKDFIVTSDRKIIEKSAIHRLFSARRPLIRNKPRLFIFNCCDGANEKAYANRDDDDDDGGKNVPNSVKVEEIDGSDGKIWPRNEENPDFRSATVHAANQGFQSKYCCERGSYVTTGFAKLMIDNIVNNNNKKWLCDILDTYKLIYMIKVNNYQKLYNNGTEYIKFKTNDAINKEEKGYIPDGHEDIDYDGNDDNDGNKSKECGMQPSESKGLIDKSDVDGGVAKDTIEMEAIQTYQPSKNTTQANGQI